MSESPLLPNKNNSNKHCTKKEKSKRIIHIVKDILSLKSNAEIAHKRSEQWGVSEASVLKYITECNKLIAERPQESTQALISKHIAIREQIFTEAEHSRDKLQCVESIAKLQNLTPDRIIIQHEKYKDIDNDKLIEVLSSDK